MMVDSNHPEIPKVRQSFIVFAVILITGSQADTFAQQPGPPATSPYQQRLSPYLDLLRADNSVLSPYHSFVRPRQQFNQRLRWQASRIGQLEQNAARLQSSRQAFSSRMPTGRGGRFQSYLHFYPTSTPNTNNQSQIPRR